MTAPTITTWTLMLFFGLGPKDPITVLPGFVSQQVCQETGDKLGLAITKGMKKKGLSKMFCFPTEEPFPPKPELNWPWLTPPTKSIMEEIKAANPDAPTLPAAPGGVSLDVKVSTETKK